MKIKAMIFITFKLVTAIIFAAIVTILLIPIRLAQFLWHFFKMAYLFLRIRNRIRRRKMPLIVINKNGIDLEEVERMQNEKDENSKMFLKFNPLKLNPSNLKTECFNPLEIFFGKEVYETGMNLSDFLEDPNFEKKLESVLLNEMPENKK